MRFEEGKFYIHDTSEYEYSDNSKQYLYCRKIYNATADTPNAEPFFMADLIGIDGSGMSMPVYEDGTPHDSEKWYTEISREEFALALLDAAIKGEDYLSEQIQRRKIAEEKESEDFRSEDFLKDFDFGF